jgi:exodeoxyribonuclease X
MQSQNAGGLLFAVMVIVFLFYLKRRQDFRGTDNNWNFKNEPSVEEDPGPSFSEAFIREQSASGRTRTVSNRKPALEDRATVECNRFLVVDFETTGVKWPYHAVEVAWIELDRNFQEIDSRSSLIKPPIRIPAEVTEIHGITNDDVADAPSLDEFLFEECGNPFENEHVCFIAHNASFDYRLFKDFCGSASLLCTVAAARRLYPKANNHKLATLASELGFEDHTAHRAVGDARTCLELLMHIREATELDFDGLLEYGNPFRVQDSLPFGKHKGVPIGEVPRDYLDWLYDRLEHDDPILPTVKLELERRNRPRKRR